MLDYLSGTKKRLWFKEEASGSCKKFTQWPPGFAVFLFLYGGRVAEPPPPPPSCPYPSGIPHCRTCSYSKHFPLSPHSFTDEGWWAVTDKSDWLRRKFTVVATFACYGETRGEFRMRAGEKRSSCVRDKQAGFGISKGFLMWIVLST